MKIALTADPELAVPPLQYGGIERMIDLLARGLSERGHEVVLFANPQSQSAGHLVPYGGLSSVSAVDTLRNGTAIARHVIAGGFDIIHSFSRIAYLAPLLPLGIPKLMTYQRAITRRSIEMAVRLSHGTLSFTAVGAHMLRGVGGIGTWHVVHNGVSMSAFTFRSDVAPDAPMVFLGRVEEIKGTHIAIEVSQRTGIPLVIAGNIAPEHRDYFEQRVKPFLSGHITYAGPVDDRQKNELLGRACAFLMPVLWEEPFGIVMAEALACGTPVIGLNRGAVPEVIEDGINGFVCNTVDGMVAAMAQVTGLSRAACRASAERNFSADVMVEKYLAIYRGMVERRA